MSRMALRAAVTDSGDQPVLLLSDPAAANAALVGTKAAILASLTQAGFQVPAGFAVAVSACAGLLAADGAELPDRLRAAIRAALDAIGGGGVFAVRSSALREDSANASAAGLYQSVLDVAADAENLDALGAALRTVVSSAGGERVQAYASRLGHGDHASAGDIAVLVQRQVAADAAGVAFTADPITGERDCTLVSAVRGVADRLVGGEVTPAEWVVRGGVATKTSAGGQESEGALDPLQVSEIAALAERVADRADVPQDVEWAIADGVVHLLQARPITALPVAPAVDLPAGTWIKESGRRAELLTPFGASVVLSMVSDGLAGAFRQGGSLLERIEMRSIGGEVYLRIRPVGGHDGAPPPWWVLAIVSRIAPPLRKRGRSARRAVDPHAIESLISEWETQLRPQVIDATRALRGADLEALTDAELRLHLDAAIALLKRGLDMHLGLIPPYALRVHEFVSTCRDLLDLDAAQSLALLAGTSEATSEPTRELQTVVALVKEPQAVRAVLAAPGADVRTRLRDADEMAGAAFDSWCERFGGRVLGEDPGAPTLIEQPAMLAGLLRDALDRRGARSGGESDEEGRGASPLARTRARLADRSVADRERFEHALAAAARVYPTREDSAVWAACHPGGLVRRAALEIGRRLVAAGALDRASDVVLLDIDAVRDAIRGHQRAGLRAAVAQARAEQAWVTAHPGPRLHGPRLAPMPDLRGLPSAVRRMNAAMIWSQNQQHSTASAADPADPAIPAGVLRGVPGAPGNYTGPVRVVRHFAEFERVRTGDVLVCPATDPSWSVLFASVGALVTDAGGALSHAAIVAREYGVPAVLAVEGATRILRDGQIVTVDGTSGCVLAGAPQSHAASHLGGQP